MSLQSFDQKMTKHRQIPAATQMQILTAKHMQGQTHHAASQAQSHPAALAFRAASSTSHTHLPVTLSAQAILHKQTLPTCERAPEELNNGPKPTPRSQARIAVPQTQHKPRLIGVTEQLKPHLGFLSLDTGHAEFSMHGRNFWNPPPQVF